MKTALNSSFRAVTVDSKLRCPQGKKIKLSHSRGVGAPEGIKTMSFAVQFE